MLNIKRRPLPPPLAEAKPQEAPAPAARPAAPRPLPPGPPPKPATRTMVFGGKPRPPSSVVEEREGDALDIVGLGPSSNLKIKRPFARIPEGAHIEVTNEYFTWIEAYKPGDKGVVLKYFSAPHAPPFSKAPKTDLYRVKLDVPRVDGVEVVTLARWEIKPIEEQ